MHPKSETCRRARMRGHSAIIMEMADEQEEGALQHGIQSRRGASDGGLRERQWSGEGVGGSSEVSLPLAGPNEGRRQIQDGKSRTANPGQTEMTLMQLCDYEG